jgi:4-amino-4-deoxy-L-arabinose transferase-like glycosyltransferase
MFAQIWIGWGIILLGFILGVLTYRSGKAERFKQALIFIILLGALLRISAASDRHLHLWDERYHALVAKNLMQQPLTPTLHKHPVLSYSNDNWVGSHIWLAKPAVPLWIMSGSIAMFGNTLLAVRLPSFILSLLAIWLTYLLGKRLFTPKVGLIAAFFFAINGLLIELAGGRVSSDHVEMCFIFMELLGIYALTLRTNYAGNKRTMALFGVGVIMGMAFLSKWYPAFLIIPIWMTLFLMEENKTWRRALADLVGLLLGTIIIALPWVLYMFAHYPVEMKGILFGAANAYAESVPSHAAPFYYYALKVLIVFGELIYLPIAYIIWRLYQNKNQPNLWLLLVWILLPFLIFSMADTKRFTYILITAPAIFICLALGLVWLNDLRKNKSFQVLASLGILLLVILPLRYTLERGKFFGNNETEQVFYTLSQADKNLLNEKAIVFGTDDYIEMMFHSDVYAAYRQLPNKEEYDQLNRQGFKLYQLKQGKLEKFIWEQ